MTQQNPQKRILVVDDNQAAADVLTDMLGLSGFLAVSAYDGPSALRIAASFAPDAVILDIGMPGMDGLAVAAELRRQAQFSTTRVIALTAWGDDLMRKKTSRAGFDEHLVKPASLATILDALAFDPCSAPANG